MTSDPVVLFSTPRTLVTEVDACDQPDLTAHWTSFPPAPDFAAWTLPQISDLIADMMTDRQEADRTSYRMIVRNKADHSFMGYANAWKISPHHFTPQLGICLNPEWQGGGMGSEIYRGLIGFAFEKFPRDIILHADVNPQNIPSLRLHFACGMQPFCFTKDGYTDGVLVEDELSMRISRAHYDRYGPVRAKLSLI